MATVTGVRRATGRECDELFALLDEWGAFGRSYQEIRDPARRTSVDRSYRPPTVEAK